VGTYWAWELLLHCGVRSAALGASAPTEGGDGRGQIVAAARLQLAHLFLFLHVFILLFAAGY